MKRLLYILSLLPLALNAQNMYNVVPLFENDLTGTARFVGMGGSMSSLGADLSTMGTNPAGTAIYRLNDFSLTMGFGFNNNKAVYQDKVTGSNSANATLDNFSFVLSSKRDGENLKYLNFGLGYRQRNNLNSAFEMSGVAGLYSQQYVIEQLYRTNPFDHNKLAGWMYDGFNHSWLTLLAAEAYLCDSTGTNFITYPDTSLVWTPDDIAYYEKSTGGVNTVDFNLSANFNDRIYLGATMGVSIVDYNRYSWYAESDAYGSIYELENSRYLKGSGFDLKLGAIFRPFKYSPFKIGLSFHTPTWYSLKEYSTATITSWDGYRISTDNSECFNGTLAVSESLMTPWRLNASMSYTFGTYLALNAEYEYADYAQSAFTANGRLYKAQNEEIGCNLKQQHIARVGAELNIDGYALRAGYNYLSAPFTDGAYKELGNAAITETSTEYMNSFEKNVVTAGLGYRGSVFYCDVAYVYEIQRAEFFPFYDYEWPNPGAAVTRTSHSLVATVGLRL